METIKTEQTEDSNSLKEKPSDIDNCLTASNEKVFEKDLIFIKGGVLAPFKFDGIHR